MKPDDEWIDVWRCMHTMETAEHQSIQVYVDLQGATYRYTFESRFRGPGRGWGVQRATEVATGRVATGGESSGLWRIENKGADLAVVTYDEAHYPLIRCYSDGFDLNQCGLRLELGTVSARGTVGPPVSEDAP